MGFCYTVRTRVIWSDDVTHERKGPGEPAGHVSYLLRLWRERSSASTWWRASLQDPHSGERIGFAHLDEMVAFLREQTGPVQPGDDWVQGESPAKMDLTSEEGGAE
jgi:hypothetical protein